MSGTIGRVPVGELYTGKADGWPARDRRKAIVDEVDEAIDSAADIVFLFADNASHAPSSNIASPPTCLPACTRLR